MLLNFLAIVFFSLLLIKATDVLVIHLKSLSRKIAVGGFALAAFLVGFSTSLPELFVGLTSAFEGIPTLSLGNLIGANISNLSLVVGLAAFLGGGVKIRNGAERRDLFYAFLAGAIPLIFLFDKELGRIEGIVLIIIYLSYNYFLLRKRNEALDENGGFWRGFLRRFQHKETKKELEIIFLSLVLIIISADIMVRLAKTIAVSINFPPFLIGLFLLAIGTSLPELVFGFEAVRKKEGEMLMGNLIGSLVINSTLIVGLVALISPIKIKTFSDYTLASVVFVTLFLLVYVFTKTKNRLEKWEGLALVAVYIIFFILELM